MSRAYGPCPVSRLEVKPGLDPSFSQHGVEMRGRTRSITTTPDPEKGKKGKPHPDVTFELVSVF